MLQKGTGSTNSRKRNQNMIDQVNANASGSGNVLRKKSDYEKTHKKLEKLRKKAGRQHERFEKAVREGGARVTDPNTGIQISMKKRDERKTSRLLAKSSKTEEKMFEERDRLDAEYDKRNK